MLIVKGKSHYQQPFITSVFTNMATFLAPGRFCPRDITSISTPCTFFRAQVYQRTFCTESFVQWSPHGSYLATLHRQGVAIWGGSSFARMHRYSHPGVSTALQCLACTKLLLLCT